MRNFLFPLSTLFLLQFLFAASVKSQEIKRCGTLGYLESQEKIHPGTIQKQKDASVLAEQWMKDHASETRNVITIPVVVHVVYHTTAENIPDNQIYSQIDVLNEDFTRRNADTFKTPSVWKSLGDSLDVRFGLAVYDPNGILTTGITRTQTAIDTFFGDEMKHSNEGGDDAWNSDNYLNVWVCNLGGGILGYASFTPGSTSDGVVIGSRVFGRLGSLDVSFNKGRTCTHEVGHWLSLSHPSGDDGGSCTQDDGCNDTPKEADNVFHCHAFPYADQCSGAPNGVMFMNYMDYTDDDCMNIFTKCQAGKMLGVLNTSRQSILTSPAGCQGPQFHVDAGISTIVVPTDTLTTEGFYPRVQLTNHGIDDIIYVEINYQVDGQPVATSFYQGTLTSQSSVVDVSSSYFTGENGHVFSAWTSNPNHSTDQYPFNDTASAPFFVRSNPPKNTTTISVQQESPTDQPTIIVLNPSAAIMHLRVVNILGQIVQEGNWPVFDHSTFTIDLTNMSNGVYFLQGKIGFDYVKKKIMVVRN